LISACLIGKRVRYDGRTLGSIDPIIADWREQGILVPVCPEVAGGAPIPRAPAEIRDGDGGDVLDGRTFIVNSLSEEVTSSFVTGARRALKIALETGAAIAILKANSPSCGNLQIYDGSFQGIKRPGQGVAAALLARNGIPVFNEGQVEAARECLVSLYKAHR
jgi:uncharacterized protein YbbK (DUF523 family)